MREIGGRPADKYAEPRYFAKIGAFTPDGKSREAAAFGNHRNGVGLFITAGKEWWGKIQKTCCFSVLLMFPLYPLLITLNVNQIREDHHMLKALLGGGRRPETFFKDLVGLGGIFSAMYLWLLIA